MENLELIVRIMSLAFIGIGILAYIITAIVAIKRKKAAGEAVNIGDEISTIANNVIKLVQSAEINTIENSAGAQKLKSVLSSTKDLCKQVGVIFDKTYWTEFINNAVELININKTKQTGKEIPLE